MIHRYTEIGKVQGNASVSLLIHEISCSFQIGFHFVRPAVGCAILERFSGLKQTSDTTAPRYLKLVTVSNFLPFYPDLLSDAVGIVYDQFGPLSTNLHLIPRP